MIRRSIPSRVPRTPPGRATRVFTPPAERDDEPPRGGPADATPPSTPPDAARPPRDGARRRARTLGVLLTAALLAPAAPAQDTPDGALVESALELELHHGTRRTRGERVERALRPTLRLALNAWADLAHAHELAVAVPERANALLLGSVDADELAELAGHLDEAFALLEPLVPEGHDAALDPAVVGFVFDAEGLHGPPLVAILGRLVEQGAMHAGGVDAFLARPGGLALRHASAFIQPGWDMAGDATAGDDEFRLANATVHQAVQAVVTRRFGQVPRAALWGLGFVVEQRLFESVYHFQAHGFVRAQDHVDWPDEARELVEDGELRGADAWLDGAAAGRATPPQRLTWAQLDWLLHEDPATLAAGLAHLGELHDAAHPYGGWPDWDGDEQAARAWLAEHVDTIPERDLRKHLKRLR